jgi:hypothetical protein
MNGIRVHDLPRGRSGGSNEMIKRQKVLEIK